MSAALREPDDVPGFGGVGLLLARFGREVDQRKLSNEMAKTRPLTVVGRARVIKDSQGGTLPAAMAKVLHGMHNHGRRTNRLPEWVWTR